MDEEVVEGGDGVEDDEEGGLVDVPARVEVIVLMVPPATRVFVMVVVDVEVVVVVGSPPYC